MGFFKKLHILKGLKNLGEHIGEVAKKVGNTIADGAKKVVNVVEKPLDLAKHAVDFVEDHAKDIKKVVDIALTVGEGIGAITGQPEIVAGLEGVKRAADKGLEIADKAKQAIDIAEKAKHIAEGVANKEKLSTLLKDTSNLIVSTTSNEHAKEIAQHLNTAANITDKINDHGKNVVNVLKKGVEVADNLKTAVENKDLGAIVKNVVEVGKTIDKGVKETKSIVSDIKDIKEDIKNPPPVEPKPIETTPVETKPVETTTPFVKKTFTIKKPLDKMTVSQLKAIIKKEGLGNISGLNKEELMKVINKHDITVDTTITGLTKQPKMNKEDTLNMLLGVIETLKNEEEIKKLLKDNKKDIKKLNKKQQESFFQTVKDLMDKLIQ